jgi:alpha-beta hydrolase superfamily lysophospholipase
MSDAAKTTIQKQIPYTTRIRHHFALFNPIVWWRAAVMRKRSVRWNTYDIIIACMLPLSGMIQPQRQDPNTPTLRTYHPFTIKSTDHWWLMLVSAAVKVPLYLYVSYKMFRTVHSITKSIFEIQQSRMMAHADAYQCLYERITQNDEMEPCRGYRTFAYDVYLPPPPPASAAAVESESPTFILFLPGAFVEHVAYAQPAALLSDHGYIVIVLSSEPLGIVDIHLPQFCVSHIRRIQHDMESKHAASTSSGRNTNQCRWIFMGHSMGSLTCTKLISYFPNVKELVLWGSAPFLEYMGHLSHRDNNNHDDDVLCVLVVQGSKDQIIQRYCTPEMIKEYWNRLPTSTTTLHEITGGTHHGFGNYILNNKEDYDSDIIPICEQHAIAVEVTIDFLRRKHR